MAGDSDRLYDGSARYRNLEVAEKAIAPLHDLPIISRCEFVTSV